jgi:predicted transcriptional regulator
MQMQLNLLNRVADTSRKAYAEICIDGSKSTRRRQVLSAIMTHPGITRGELAELLSVRLSGVCGRCAELIADGHIRENGVKQDEYTRKTVAMLWAV